jgi:general secretion pathway protein D
MRWLCFGAAVLLLCGCAANTLHGEGIALLDEGKYEEAVAKLEEASKQAPEDVEFRRDFIRAREQVLNHLVMLGDNERAGQRFDAAEAAYRRALQVAPDDTRIRMRLRMVDRDRRHASIVAQAEALIEKGAPARAADLLKTVLLENPNHGRALELQQQITEAEARRSVATPALGPNFAKPVTLQFRDANLKMVFESISRTSGINILLDKDVRADVRTSIFVKDTSVEDAIDLILMQNQLEKKVLSENTLFIYPFQAAKSRAYQDLKVRSFHLVHADAKQMLTLIKTMLKTKDIMIHEKTNSLIMRDTPEAVALAAKIVSDQDIAAPEVMLEVEVLEVTRTLLSDLGIRYPDAVTLKPSVPGGGDLTVGNFSTAVRRDNLLVSPVPTVTFNASLTRGNTRVLASPRLRTRTKEKAKIHIGDRLPVFTNSITPLSTGAAVTTGTVQYVETGIKLEVEPDIHPNGEVTIKVNLEVSVAQAAVTNPQSGTTAYPISTRTTSTVLQLRDGETNVLAGLIRDTEATTKVMIPGLGEIPGLGRLFGTQHTDGTRTEIILSITPRLAGSTTLPNARFVEFWSGTAENPGSEPFQLRPGGSISMSSSASGQPGRQDARPPARPKPGVPPPMAFNWQGPTQAKVGSKFRLILNTQSRRAVENLGLTLSYDPAALKAVEAVEGSFVRLGGAGATFTQEINQEGGQINVALTSGGVQGTRGAGSLTAITFEVLAAGASQISIAQVTPTGPAGENVEFAEPAVHNMTLQP